jgi:hypothetical protein
MMRRNKQQFAKSHNPRTVLDTVIKLLLKSLLLSIFAGIISKVRVKDTTLAPHHGFTQFNV